MGVFEIVGGAIMILVSVVIMLAVMVQESPRDSGLASLGAGSDSYFSKNQGRTRDAMLNRIVKICAAAFFIITVAVYALARQ